ncbi:MAG: L,D-transpeptidase family protein [Chloroflexota bacterium]
MARRQSTDRLLTQAQTAIEQGRLENARVLLEAAARQDAADPRPWLLLAGIAGSARERRAFLTQAERLKPGAGSLPPAPLQPVVASGAAAVPLPQTISYPAPTQSGRTGGILARTGLIIAFVLALAAGVYLFAQSPVGSALVQDVTGQMVPAPDPVEVVAAASEATPTEQAALPTPTLAVAAEETPSADVPDPTDTPPATEEAPEEVALLPTKEVAADGEPLATWTVTAQPTPTLAPTATPTVTPEPSPTPEPPPPGSPRPAAVAADEKWIDVNLTTQTLVAYEGDTPVLTTLISSGQWQYPTVTGEFRTYLKYETQLMSGYHLGFDYYTPDVPFVMYFYRDFAIHGAYWHNSFGTPVSHGCVNATPADAGWLFNWAPLGTFVTVHY